MSTPTYEVYPTTCKFCGKGIELEIDSEYLALRDPLKLIAMTACTQCSELHTLRRTLGDDIEKAVWGGCAMSQEEFEQKKESLRTTLTDLINRYCRMCAELQGVFEPVFDSEIVEQLIALHDAKTDPKWPKHNQIITRARSMLHQCWKLNRPYGTTKN